MNPENNEKIVGLKYFAVVDGEVKEFENIGSREDEERFAKGNAYATADVVVSTKKPAKKAKKAKK